MQKQHNTPNVDNTALATFTQRLKARAPGNDRLLFIQLPQVILGAFNRDVALNRSYYVFPPTGLQCLADAVRHRGLDIRILDLNFEILKQVHADPAFDPDSWPDLLARELDAFDPSVIGVSCLFDFSIPALITALELIRKNSDAVTVAGGVIANYEWQDLLERDIVDFVIKGEGENKLNFLLDQLSDAPRHAKPTPGIMFRDAGALHESDGPPDVVDMAGTLVDTYDLVPVEEYARYGSLNPYSRMAGRGTEPFAAIQFSRGCRAACSFCAVRDFMGKGMRARPVDDVMAEMTYLVEQRGVRHFEWLDDDLLFFRDPFKEILRRIVAKGWDIRWSANNGLIAASLDAETLDLMQRSGCVGFKIGIETGNPDMLKLVRKPGTHRRFREAGELLNGYPDIFVGGNFIVGLPDEKFHQMMDSFKFALEVGLDWAAFTVCQMIRGASAFADAGEYFENQMKADGATAANFLPSRHSKTGEIDRPDDVAKGPAVFALAPDAVPSAEQTKEIWFAFNLLANYVFNKNLGPGGRPEKFVGWLEPVLRAYPANPYMNVFTAIGLALSGDAEKAADFQARAADCTNSDYWHDRMDSFHLTPLLRADVSTPDAAADALAAVRDANRPPFAAWTAVDYGETPPTGIAAAE